ncbi:MAG: hypothetical protein ACLUSP_08715 [Christensenellales bacterium]
MEVSSKKVAFLGDSITEGSGASKVENRYTDVFGRISARKCITTVSAGRVSLRNTQSPTIVSI